MRWQRVGDDHAGGVHVAGVAEHQSVKDAIARLYRVWRVTLADVQDRLTVDGRSFTICDSNRLIGVQANHRGQWHAVIQRHKNRSRDNHLSGNARAH